MKIARLIVLLLLNVLSLRAAGLAEFDAYCRKALHDWNVPGFSIAIVQGDEVALARGFGVRDLGRQEPVTEHTLFGIASNTKAFTAAALAILVHRGAISWEDRVQDHLPWFQVFQDPWISREARVDDLLCPPRL